MKLLLIIIEGQLYLAGIVAIFDVAELGFLFWGLWSRRPIIGLVAVFVTAIETSAVSPIRASFFRIGSRRHAARPIRGTRSLRFR